MIKKIYLSLTIALFISASLAAQKPGDWSIGIVFQPCLYWKYNKADWNNRPASYPEQLRNFNGWAAGISVNRYINQTFSIGGELLYSKQHQDFKATNTVSNDKIIYNIDVTNASNYVKTPLFVCAKYEIGYETGLYLKMLCGPQFSFNSHYKSEFKAYLWDPYVQTVDYAILTSKITISPEKSHQDFLESNGSYSMNDSDTPYLYRRLEFGLVGGISLEKQLGYRYKMSLGIRYELGITNVENTNANGYYLTFNGTTGPTGETVSRPATHNRRLALDLGISRIID